MGGTRATITEIQTIKQLRGEGYNNSQIARKVRRCQSFVSRVTSGKSYAEVTGTPTTETVPTIKVKRTDVVMEVVNSNLTRTTKMKILEALI